jgi:hypothetical protein
LTDFLSQSSHRERLGENLHADIQLAVANHRVLGEAVGDDNPIRAIDGRFCAVSTANCWVLFWVMSPHRVGERCSVAPQPLSRNLTNRSDTNGEPWGSPVFF